MLNKTEIMNETKNNQETTYQLNLKKEQLDTVARGLEFYSRFLAGQWVIPMELQTAERKAQIGDDGDTSAFYNKVNYVNDLLRTASNIFMEQKGIGDNRLTNRAGIAYDIYRPILELFSSMNNSNGVYSYPGLSYSKEGRINIKIIEHENE